MGQLFVQTSYPTVTLMCSMYAIQLHSQNLIHSKPSVCINTHTHTHTHTHTNTFCSDVHVHLTRYGIRYAIKMASVITFVVLHAQLGAQRRTPAQKLFPY